MNAITRLSVICCLMLGVASATAEQARPLPVSDATFECIRGMTPVRGFYVDNIAGDLAGTLMVANNPDGGTYPAGSVVQLVPGEAMIKHPAGTSPATADWEFFELDTSSAGTSIRKRGYADVVNRFGGNCLACHAKANPGRDMICETGHGCDPIPLTRDILVLLQNTDPRCKNNPPLSPEDMKKLQALQQALAANR